MDVGRDKVIVERDFHAVATAAELRSVDGGAAMNGAGGSRLRREFWDYVGLLRRRWWLIAITCSVSVGAVWWSQKDRIPEYTATVLIQQSQAATAGVVSLIGSGPREDLGYVANFDHRILG